MTQTNLKFFDAHAHLISDDTERYPKNPIPVSIEGIPPGTPWGPGIMGFPGGMHGPTPNNIKPTAEQLHGWMEEQNVVGAAAVQKGLIYRTDNSYIVDAASLFPEQMSAVIIIDPREEGTLEMIREYSERGVVGIRFFPIEHVADKVEWLTSDRSLEIWQLADDLGIVVDIEAPGNDHDVMVPLIEQMSSKYPKLRIVLDHVMLPKITEPNYGLDTMFERLRALPRVFVKWTSINLDIAHVNSVEPDKHLRAIVDFFGADKVMWGSDIGTSSGTYAEMIERAVLAASVLSDEEKRKVFFETGHRLFAEPAS